jgi:hypothetical protein
VERIKELRPRSTNPLDYPALKHSFHRKLATVGIIKIIEIEVICFMMLFILLEITEA